MSGSRLLSTLVLALATLAVAAAPAWSGSNRPAHESPGRLTWASPQSNPIAVSPDGAWVYVAATTSNAVDVIRTSTSSWFWRIEVGIEPVSVAFKPDGTEVWVANHVSDSVSVIDNDPANATYLKVIHTIDEIDANGATLFDEPVGIAFKGDGSQAYVALSSRNDIAVIDTASYSVITRRHIAAQDPRAITVRNNRLFVTAFESNNKTEVSACGLPGTGSAPQCTMFVTDLIAFATNPNLPGVVKNIVVDPGVPDRDLFVYDVSGSLPSTTPIDVVEGVGTLLYGVAVDGAGRVFVANTDARNAANGLEESSPGVFNDVDDLDNRMFLNRVTRVSCGGGGDPCSGSNVHIELDAAVGATPAAGTQLATPFGVAISADDGWLIGTAAGSSRMFVLDLNAATGGTPSSAIAARLDVGEIPRGVALRSDPSTGAPLAAYVLNTLGNSVSVVNLTTPSAPSLTKTITVGNDPTPAAVRIGRIAFNDADASTQGTFSCASCHPDGNTDQLVWRIGGSCFFGQCTGHGEPRTTMPVRGLRDTLPLHWDGTLGDPFGGPNGATGASGSQPANCGPGQSPVNCFRQLVNESLGGVMCEQPCGSSELDDAARDHMAVFLESVSYPPARSRRADDKLTTSAKNGFADFYFDQNGGSSQPDTCADSNAGCHELPLGTASNSEVLQGFDAPTMRGMTDRFLQFSLGITATEEMLVFANAGFPALGIPPLEPSIRWAPAKGMEEITSFGVAFTVFDPVYNVRPLDLFQWFEEASTGHSGALGRQVTVHQGNAGGADIVTDLDEIENADERGVVNVRGIGFKSDGMRVFVSYLGESQRYQVDMIGNITRADFLSRFQGATPELRTVTLTANLRSGITESVPQPLIAPVGANCSAGTGPTGDPALPSGSTLEIEAAHVAVSDVVLLDGDPQPSATIQIVGPTVSCAGQIATNRVRILLGATPANGRHLLQLQTRNGLLSNELPFCQGSASGC